MARFELWTEQRYRPTRDADFLARDEDDPERFAKMFKELCVADVFNDGDYEGDEDMTKVRVSHVIHTEGEENSTQS